MDLLDLIFPKYCVNCKKYGDYLCSNCFSRLSYDTQNICLVCRKPSYDCLTHPKCKGKYAISGSFTGVTYGGIAKKLLYKFKYKPYISGLGNFISSLLYESLIQNEGLMRAIGKKESIFVPIPLSSKKYKQRGYNQSEILAKYLGKKFDIPVFKFLERVRETNPQLNIQKDKRREIMADAFELNQQLRSRIKNKNIFLIDDVLITGSTLSEAAKIIKKNGAKEVWGIAFAREK